MLDCPVPDWLTRRPRFRLEPWQRNQYVVVLAVGLGVTAGDRGVNRGAVARSDEIPAALGGVGGARVREDLFAELGRHHDRCRGHRVTASAIHAVAAIEPRQYASAT